GLWDLVEIVNKLAGLNFEFQFVGPQSPEADMLIASLAGKVTVVPKQPQAELPERYAWGDLFIFPTIEDGYAVVLAQAAAAGLPLLTTSNCAGPDLVREGETGWVLPIRSPEEFVERLKWCEAHRPEMASMARLIPTEFQPRD